MSIRGRLTLWFTALFGLTIFAMAITAYVVVRKQVFSQLDSSLQIATGATAMSAEHEMNEHPTKQGGEEDLQSVLDQAGSPDLTDTQILVKEQTRAAAYRAGAGRVDLRRMPASTLKNGSTANGLRIASRQLQIPKFGATYEILAATRVAPAEAQIAQVRTLLLIIFPLGLLLASVGGYLLAGRSLKPLQEFAGIVDTVTSSDLTSRVTNVGKADEISRLGLRFNALLDRLEQAFTLQRRFMADASHQIRTPMTVALAAAQVGKRDQQATNADLRDALTTIEKQMLQLRRIVEDMFFLSHADTAPLKLEAQEMYLDDAVADAARAGAALARSKGQTLRWSGLPEARCIGDSSLLTQAVLNLLDNAIKFTPAGGVISVFITRREEHWICSVQDSGAGIPLKDQERIFQRFFQANHRSKEAGGAGLGLAIAQTIVESHGGSLTLVESRPGQTTFELAIPALHEGVPAAALAHANSPEVRM